MYIEPYKTKMQIFGSVEMVTKKCTEKTNNILAVANGKELYPPNKGLDKIVKASAVLLFLMNLWSWYFTK